MFKREPRPLPDELALYALSRALGNGLESLLPGALSQALSLVYWIDTSLSSFSDTHVLEVTSTVQPDRLVAVLDRVLEILSTVRHQGIDADLLDIVKRGYRRSLLSGQDNCRWLASALTMSALQGEPWNDLALKVAIMDGLTPDTVRDAARDIMTASNTMICSVGALEVEAQRRVALRVAEWMAGAY